MAWHKNKEYILKTFYLFAHFYWPLGRFLYGGSPKTL